MRGAEILAMTLVAAALLFFVARPLVKGVFDGPSAGSAVMPMGLPGQAMGMAGAGNVAALPGGEAGTGDERVDIARIQGSVNANAMKQVSQMVSENPEQTVSVIRAWLQERR